MEKHAYMQCCEDLVRECIMLVGPPVSVIVVHP
jgi:hypothetical protein